MMSKQSFNGGILAKNKGVLQSIENNNFKAQVEEQINVDDIQQPELRKRNTIVISLNGDEILYKGKGRQAEQEAWGASRNPNFEEFKMDMRRKNQTEISERASQDSDKPYSDLKKQPFQR